MIGATAKADQFLTRSGSDATKGSRTGINLLGWGCDEELDIRQQLDAVRAAIKKLNDRFVEIKAEFLTATDEKHLKRLRKERGQAVDRLAVLNEEARRLKAHPQMVCGKFNITDHIIDIFRERVTKSEWDRIVAEAQRRFEATASSEDGK